MDTRTNEAHAQRVLRALLHLQETLDGDPRLEELARIAGYSPWHFHRVFRALVGESLAEHVRRLRLERAAVRLRLGERPILELALEAGYASHEAFTRAFKEHFGLPPAEYRREARALPAAPSGVHWGDADERALRDAFRPLAGEPVPLRVERLPARRVVFLRHVGPYSEVGASWGRLAMWAGMRGLIGAEAFFGLCHDDPHVTPPAKLRYDACVPLGAGAEVSGEGEIGVTELPAGPFAFATHVGPYEDFERTYTGLVAGLIARAEHELGDGPCVEIYRNDPRSTPPAELVTDVGFPLRA